MSTLITSENLGAWLIKCDPDEVFDLQSFMEDGNDWISNWSVVNNYRARMMAAGDKVIFWVSGSSKRVQKGIWGVGFVTGGVEDPDPEEAESSELGYWLDREKQQAVIYGVPLDIVLFDEPITPNDLAAAGIADLEVQRMPGGSNPSWVDRTHLDAIDEIVGGWDDYTERSTFLEVGAGRVDLLDRNDPEVLNAAATAAVIEFYDGWDVEAAEADDAWDIRFTDPDSDQVCNVRITGVRGADPTVMLTPAEVASAAEDEDWFLAVVTHALTAPEVCEYNGAMVQAMAAPLVYKADFGTLADDTRSA